MTDTNTDIANPEERAYLKKVKTKIQAELDEVACKMESRSRDMRDVKKYLAENQSDMDHVEKAAGRQMVEEMGIVGDHGALGAVRLSKLLKSAYFGRIDFQARGESDALPVYIGIHSLYDPENKTYLVHDWRAPISSMFYDFEMGEAWYVAPAGKESGKITGKRQYKIEGGELVFMLESSLNIHDDILQKELSRGSSEKMKNIVATIQRDQNAIIRNDQSQALIIQGAAGSGKTSIALHRIAFLLYRFKDSISSNDILIISPNKVFAHYISNVLPELGEENIQETTMEALATELLGDKYQFQTFYEQVAALFEAKNQKYQDRIQYKASLSFLENLDEYILHVKNNNFTPTRIVVGRSAISAELVGDKFYRFGNLPIAERLNELVNALVEELEREFGRDVKKDERDTVRKQLKQMFGSTNLDALYKGFFTWMEEPGMFKFSSRGVYEYSDVYPLIYFKMQLEGMTAHDHVKHLVVDEMQDYTPVQYTVLSQLYPCKKTILGDANQSVNPLSSSTAEKINAIFHEAECVYMNKSYRSTIQISNLAQRINRNKNLIPIERHGEDPEFRLCANEAEELNRVRSVLATFFDSDYKSLGIVCKTQEQANAVYNHVQDLSNSIFLIDPTSSAFNEGVTISTAHLAKGLEFDEVILPFCNDKNYASVIDRHMLYVGCTRGMHKLTLTYSGELPAFLRD